MSWTERFHYISFSGQSKREREKKIAYSASFSLTVFYLINSASFFPAPFCLLSRFSCKLLNSICWLHAPLFPSPRCVRLSALFLASLSPSPRHLQIHSGIVDLDRYSFHPFLLCTLERSSFLCISFSLWTNAFKSMRTFALRWLCFRVVAVT